MGDEDLSKNPLDMINQVVKRFETMPAFAMMNRVHSSLTIAFSVWEDMMIFLFFIVVFDALQLILMSDGVTHSTIQASWLGIDLRF